MQFSEREVSVVEPLSRGRNPFGQTGVERDAERRRALRRAPALAGGDAARERRARRGGHGAGGGGWPLDQLRRAVGARRPRGRRAARAPASVAATASRIRLANGIDWVLAFFGAQLLGAVVVPVNTRFTEEEVAYVVEDSGAAFTFAAGAALPDGEPVTGEELAPGGPRGDLLHERHDRLSQGRDDLAWQLPDQQRERVPLPVRSSAPRDRRSRRSCRCRCST